MRKALSTMIKSNLAKIAGFKLIGINRDYSTRTKPTPIRKLFDENKLNDALEIFLTRPSVYDALVLVSKNKLPTKECLRIYVKLMEKQDTKSNIIFMTHLLSRKDITDKVLLTSMWNQVVHMIDSMSIASMKKNINSYGWNLIVKNLTQVGLYNHNLRYVDLIQRGIDYFERVYVYNTFKLFRGINFLSIHQSL